MPKTKSTKNEIFQKWGLLDRDYKTKVILAHLTALNLSTRTYFQKLYRIFDLGNPLIVIGKNTDSFYCRIDQDDVKPMTVLIKNYLK